ncbi:hypothetical protein SFRURICE_007414, partial [Spodoptera frugiperda]
MFVNAHTTQEKILRWGQRFIKKKLPHWFRPWCRDWNAVSSFMLANRCERHSRRRGSRDDLRP